MSKIRTSAIVYRGPSLLERRSPIVAIVTGLDGSSSNPKTGRMAHLWILRSDVNPVEAVQTRQDSAVCGDCGLRGTGTGDRGCYVTVVNAPNAVYKAFKRRRYADVDPTVVNATLRDRGLSLRLGAYGEPAALPVGLLRQLTAGINHTGYTHQWRKRPALRSVVMASCDSPTDYADATAGGWRSFRTRTADQPLSPDEIICPASDEGNHRTTCADCSLCDGNHSARLGKLATGPDRRRSIAIIVHGATSVHAMAFIRSRSDVR